MSQARSLGDRVRLANRSAQSSGELYDLFLAEDDRGIFKWHHYFDVYQRYLSRFRGTAARLLEIGVRKGGSLVLWSEFLGPAAHITGVDVDPRARIHEGRCANVSVRIGDQADADFLVQVVEEFGPFDVVIDDGGHTARQQINSFNCLYPLMAERGVYLCEDTHTSYLPAFMDAGPGVTMIEYAKRLLDRLHEPYQVEEIVAGRFGTRPEERDGSIGVSRFAAETFAISFYDSMIVFERRPRLEPFREQR